MDGFSIFLSGLALGFSIAAPVGPIGVLCIRRTLAEGRLAGVVSGLGAATADAFYGTLAAFGLSLITDVLVKQQIWLRVIGGVFLVYLGVHTLLTRASMEPANAKGGGLWMNFLSTLGLTLTNPMTILSFVAIFAGLGLSSSGGAGRAALLIGGVFSGSAAWWLFLALGVGIFRNRLQPVHMTWINRISGAFIAGFGVWLMIGLLIN